MKKSVYAVYKTSSQLLLKNVSVKDANDYKKKNKKQLISKGAQAVIVVTQK